MSRIKEDSYQPGDLVLICNNPIKNSVSKEQKTANKYMGPYQIQCCTQGGSYILAEMDGSILRHHVAAFRLIPYVQRQDLDSWEHQTESGNDAEDGSDPETTSDSDQELPSSTHSNSSTP